MTKQKSYFEEDIDLDKLLKDSGVVDDIMRMEDIKARKLYLTGEIYSDNADEISKLIMRYNKEDVGKPVEERQRIILYINSVGGDVFQGFEIIDSIVASKTPVVCVVTGVCYSMAVPILAVCHKRYSFGTASFLIHDGTSAVADSSSKAQDFLAFSNSIRKKIKDTILANSEIPAKLYAKKMREEWYMYADEALGFKLIDGIVGKDIDIDECI